MNNNLVLSVVVLCLVACGGPPAEDGQVVHNSGNTKVTSERLVEEHSQVDLSAESVLPTVGLFSERLWNEDDVVRVDSLDALTQAKDPASADAISYLLSHHDPHVRQDAVDALVDLGIQEVEIYLRDALADSNPAVSDAAADGLMELGYKSD